MGKSQEKDRPGQSTHSLKSKLADSQVPMVSCEALKAVSRRGP